MSRPSRFLLAATAVAAFCLSGIASAQRFYDPPGRVARISDMRGYVSYSPAGDGEWYDAHRNRPLVRGDALWSDRGARAELQAGSTWLRMDGETSLEFLQLDDRMLQVEVVEGTINVRVRRLYPGQRIEVDTPNVAFVIDRPGNFRIDVDREGDNTAIEARQGGGMVYGIGGRFAVRSGDVVVFYGEDVRDYELYAFPGQDDFDRYVRMRDMRIDRSLALRYLGDDLIGYSDLDDYGRWSRYPEYGAVWFPSNVYAGWAPYQDGQWVWQEPWGWTWVDDEPWGFAPSHYGRWAWIDGRWGWVPGPRTYRPVYAPALVAFLELAGGSIGWFPLGPGDVYYPTYNVSSNYFRAVNIANTRVNTTTVNNVYNSYARASAVPLAQGAYRNRTVPTAVTTVPQDVFVNSRPVREARRENREAAAAAPARGLQLRRELGLRPQRASVRGASAAARVRPPRAVEDEQVVVHNAPPVATTAPSATSTPAPAAPVRERPRRVRQVTEAQAATDARARGPRREGGSAAAATPPATPSATTPAPQAAPGGGRLRALDRDALPRARGARRNQESRPREEATPATTPATAPAPAAEPAPAAATPAPAAEPAPAAATPAPAAQEAREAQQKAREEQRQALEAQRKAREEQRDSERALEQARVQRQQAEADASAQQQREAAEAEAKAVQERQQAREAQREAQRQQRESQQAQRDAAQQQAEAATDAPKAGEPAPAEAPRARPGRAECVPQERIDAMRKRGVSEERLAEMKVCPAEAPAPTQP